MGLGWPAALAGLLAVGVPLVIHLLQRGEYRRVDFATTRFVIEHQRLRWRRLKMTQPWLLALRILLIVLCVALLAEPYSRGPVADRDGGGWALVSPRVAASDARERAPDGAELRWLAHGFPALDENPPAWTAGTAWSLLAEADTQAPAGRPIYLIAPTDAAGLSTTKPALSRPVEWIAAPGATAPPTPRTELDIDIIATMARRDDAARVLEALSAWQNIGLETNSRVVPDTAPALSATYTVWLSDRDIAPAADQKHRVVLTDLPATGQAGQVINFDASGRPLVVETRTGNTTIRTLTGGHGIDEAATGNDDFARRLLTLLLDAALVEPPPDYPVADAQLSPRVLDSTAARESVRRPWSDTLVWLILAAALAERLASAWTMGQARDT